MSADKQHNACLPEEMLSAHLDGDLEDIEVTKVEAHLADCETCKSTLEELQSLKIDLPSLAAVEPRTDLWNQIRVRHEEEATRSPLAWLRLRWALPAFVVAGATAALLFIIQPLRPATDLPPDKTQALARAYAGVLEAEQIYLASIEALEKAVAADTRTMSPEVQRAIEHGLAQIDETIQQCRLELQKAPHDFRAHRVLLAAYQRKVDLLTDLVDRTI